MSISRFFLFNYWYEHDENFKISKGKHMDIRLSHVKVRFMIEKKKMLEKLS